MKENIGAKILNDYTLGLVWGASSIIIYKANFLLKEVFALPYFVFTLVMELIPGAGDLYLAISSYLLENCAHYMLFSVIICVLLVLPSTLIAIIIIKIIRLIKNKWA